MYNKIYLLGARPLLFYYFPGIVEMMAAGLLTIAHRSGGPLMDIITEEAGTRNGFLAVTAQEYAAHIAFIISMTEEVSLMIF